MLQGRAFADKKPVRRKRRGQRLAYPRRLGLVVLVTILCPLLLAGCAGPAEVADRPTDAPQVGPAPSASDEQNAAPFRLEPAAVPASPVGSPVAQRRPTKPLSPPGPSVAAKEASRANGGPTITFEKTVHDYGEIAPQSSNVCEFRFKNTGTAVLRVEPKIVSTCGCTAPLLAKTEYAPGEEGVIKVTHSAENRATKTTKYLTVCSNDRDQPQVRLTIIANVVPKVACEPEQLDLSIKDNVAMCPPITLRSLDGTPFSVTGMFCSGNCLTAKLDPSAQAAAFTLQPTPDVEKLQKIPVGSLMLTLTHPECKQVTIGYKLRSGFQFVPVLPMFFDAKPNVPIQKAVYLSNNEAKDFEIASFSSERNLVQVVEKTKTAPQGGEGARYRLQVSITPPPKTTGAERIFTATLLVHLTTGQTLKLDCRGFYATERSGTYSPSP